MTSHLRPDDFAEFFSSVHGVRPFPWQEALAALVFTEGWPGALDVPTGAGKTAAIDIAIFHLALEAERGAARTAPVRIAFVVDRRLVVDAAFDRGARIAAALANPAGGVLEAVRDRLRSLAERPERAVLRVARLRGGAPREPDWARSPAQPTILVSTVDQVGSRLLFRGYGVSDRMKPIHAGLLGTDTLLLLDEAHLSQPFTETVSALRQLRESSLKVSVCELSATQVRDVVSPLSAADDQDAVLGRRLRCSKAAELVEVKGTPGDESWLVECQARCLAGLRSSAPRVVAVVVNRVAHARALYETIARAVDEQALPADVALLTGRTRPLGRDQALLRLLPRMAAEGRPVSSERSLVVVATQCIEAGADLDFDDLITELAPLDCLRQRFGRLNRTGRAVDASAVILAASSQIGKRARPDVIYGDALAKTWELLQAKAAKVGRGAAAQSRIDFGIRAAAAWLPGGLELAQCLAPRASAPVLMPSFVEQWANTSPLPVPDADVSLFLHGPGSSRPDVQVVWRADLDSERTSEWVERIVALPPSSLEAVPVPIYEVRRWLAEAKGISDAMADVEGADRSVDREELAGSARRVLQWRGDESKDVPGSAIRPGDTVVVPAAYGGCDQWGWSPASRHLVTDLADQAALLHRGLDVIRLSPALLATAISDEALAGGSAAGDAHALGVSRARALQSLLVEISEDSDTSVVQAVLAADLWPAAWMERMSPRGRWVVERSETGAPLLLRRRAHDAALDPGGAPVSEDESSSRGQLSVTLAEHSAGVEEMARRFSRQAGLPAEISADVALAAFLHDAGKAHPTFKRWLYAGDELAAHTGPALAKSGRLRLGDAARQRAGLPPGARHEVASLFLAKGHPRFLEAHDPDLVLWLVGTHHGLGRPFFPAVEWPSAGDVYHADLPDGRVTSKECSSHPALLTEWMTLHARVHERYGPWRLAHLEATLRLADHRRSELEQEDPS